MPKDPTRRSCLTATPSMSGRLAEEFFELAIDPYPRKEGADYAVPDDPDRPDSPFAGLAELKKR